MRLKIVRVLAMGALLLAFFLGVSAAPVSAGQGGGGAGELFDGIQPGQCWFFYNATAGNFLVGRMTGSGILRVRSSSTSPASCEDKGAVPTA